MGDHERTLKIKHVDISMKRKLFVTRSGGNFGTLRFFERSFLETI